MSIFNWLTRPRLIRIAPLDVFTILLSLASLGGSIATLWFTSGMQ